MDLYIMVWSCGYIIIQFIESTISLIQTVLYQTKQDTEWVPFYQATIRSFRKIFKLFLAVWHVDFRQDKLRLGFTVSDKCLELPIPVSNFFHNDNCSLYNEEGKPVIW